MRAGEEAAIRLMELAFLVEVTVTGNCPELCLPAECTLAPGEGSQLCGTK